MMNHCPGWCLIGGLAALVLPAILQGASDGGLRLVAETSGATYDQFTVVDDRVAVRRGGNEEAVPPDAVWRLDGDLRASAEFFWFTPEYDIVTTLANETLESDPVLRHALIRLRGRTAWDSRTLRDGIAVVVWLVEGRAREVVPVIARVRHDEVAGLVAAAAIPLNAETARGAPAVLLLKGNRFVVPHRLSKDAAANAALEDLFLGSTEQFARSVGAMKNINLRPERPADNRPVKLGAVPGEVGAINARLEVGSGNTWLVDETLYSLPDLATEAGRTDALRVMLERGAEMNRTGTRPSAALQAAVHNGRFETLALLQSASVEALQTESSRGELRQQALAAGHANVAALLLESGGGADADAIARAALLQGDLTALTELIARGGTATLLAQPPALVAFNLRLGRAAVIRALLQAGLSPQGSMHETPWLVTAAAAAQPEIVRLLLENGAAVDGAAPGGATPLIAAATRGTLECIDLLLAAGADVNSVHAHGLTALHFAVVANKPAVVERLLERGRAEQRRNVEGRSPLDLALAMQSRHLVELLVRHGGTIDLTQSARDESIQHAIVIDAVNLLQRVVADGWNPHARFHGEWTAAAIAELHGAKQCAAWLATQGSDNAGPGASLERGDVAAALAEGEKPAEARITDLMRPAVSVKVTGVVTADGAFHFPGVTGCDDARLTHAVVTATRNWRFRPATVAGRAVASRVALMVPFAGVDRRVFPATEVGSMPAPIAPESAATGNAAIRVAAQMFRPGRGGGAPMQTTVDFGGTVSTESGDFWAAAAFVVEPDGRPGEMQLLGAEGVVPQEGWSRTFSGWRFTPGQSDGRPVRTRVTMVVQSEQ